MVRINDGEIPLLIDIYTEENHKEVMKLLQEKNVNTLGYHPPLSSAEYLLNLILPMQLLQKGLFTYLVVQIKISRILIMQ